MSRRLAGRTQKVCNLALSEEVLIEIGGIKFEHIRSVALPDRRSRKDCL